MTEPTNHDLQTFVELERAIHSGIAPNWMTVAHAVGSQEHYNAFLHDIAASVLRAGFVLNAQQEDNR